MTNAVNVQQDRKALRLFIAVTIVLCTVAYVPMLSGGGFGAMDGYALGLLMWSPGLAGIISCLVVYRSLAPLGLVGIKRAIYWMAGCFALPIAYALVLKGGLAATGMVSLGGGDIPAALFLTGIFLSLRTALGEELGWRGFAAPVLTRVFGFWRGQTLLGVFWFLFHVPALMGTTYGSSPHPWFGNFMFFITCMTLSYFLGWARLKSNSVWPGALFHASHNLYFLHLFEPLEVKHDFASYLIGEQGLLCALVQIALAIYTLWLWRQQSPDAKVPA